MRIGLLAIFIAWLGFLLFEGEESQLNESLIDIEERLVLEESGVEVKRVPASTDLSLEDSKELFMAMAAVVKKQQRKFQKPQADYDLDQYESVDGVPEDTRPDIGNSGDLIDPDDPPVEVVQLKTFNDIDDPRHSEISPEEFNPEFLESFAAHIESKNGSVSEEVLYEEAQAYAGRVYEQMLDAKTEIIQNENILRAVQSYGDEEYAEELEERIRKSDAKFGKLKDKMASLFN
jgi:hypothetical protein